MIINHFRTYEKDKTTGVVYCHGLEPLHSLEDVGRPVGVKIQDETCIPEGVYWVVITRSNRFGKDMMLLYNVADDLSVERDGVRFTGIRVHRGSTIEHTAGCVLVRGYERIQALVAAEIARGEAVFWVISSEDFN